MVCSVGMLIQAVTSLWIGPRIAWEKLARITLKPVFACPDYQTKPVQAIWVFQQVSVRNPGSLWCPCLSPVADSIS